MNTRRVSVQVVLFIVFGVLLFGLVAGCGSTTTTTAAPATTTTAAPATTTTAAQATTTTAAGPAAPVVKEWVIPVIGVQTGPAAGWGLDAIWAAKLAEKQINEAGGVRGIPIKLEIYDTAAEVDKSLTVMDTVLKTKPLVIDGPVFQTMADAAGPMAVEEGVLMLCGINIGNDGDNLKPWFASLYGNMKRTWEIGVQQWVKLHPEVKSVVLFYVPDNQQWEMAFTEGAFQALGINILGKIECTQGQLDFGPTATKAYELKPDGYYSVLQGAEQSKLLIELKKLGFSDGSKMAYGPGADSATLYESGKGYLEDTYIWDIYFVYNDSPRWKVLSEAYQAENKGALPYSPVIAANYDSVYAIATALEKTNATGDPAKLKEERTAIRDFMVNAQGLKGVQGDYNYSNGLLISPVYFMQIKDNAPKLLTTVPAS